MSIAADAATLRRIAQFLVHAATLTEAQADRFEHEHLSEFDRTMPATPQFVVSRD